MRNAPRLVALLGVVISSALSPRPVRVIRARWKHSHYGVALPHKVRHDGPKVAPGPKVYGEWLAALVDEFGRQEVAGWSSEKELPSEWEWGVWMRSRRM